MGKPHAVLFPIPLQGHINPMMVLAEHLHSSGVRVTFLLTERTLSILRKNNSSSSKHDIIGHAANGNIDNGSANNGCINNGSTDNRINNNGGTTQYCGTNDCINNGSTTQYGSANGGCIEKGGTTHYGAANGSIVDSGSGATTHYSSNTIFHKDGDECGSACNDHFNQLLPPIEFETLPDSSTSSDNPSLPMSAAVLLFLDSMPLIRKKVEEILEGLHEKGTPATCIISDSFVPWTQDVANKFGIPRMEFWSSSATVYSMGFHIPRLIDGGYLPVQPGMEHEFCIDIIPGLAPFKLVDFFCIHVVSSPIFELISKAFSRATEAQSVLINSFYHLEKEIIDAMCEEGVSIEPIGPLIPSQTCEPHTIKMQRGEEIVSVTSTSWYTGDDANCLAWLDTQAKKSVIYVSFGSMVNLSEDELHELILGLEASQQPYLLVVRPDMVPGSSTSIAGEKGQICTWVPQISVLGHPAIGGFMTHCGWNSIMEGIYMGVPMIGCPRESEQHTNMKCLRDEWKVAIGLDHHHYSCQRELLHYKGSPTNKVKIKKELVEQAIRALMQKAAGIALRAKVQDLQSVAQCATLGTISKLHSLCEKT